MSIVTWYGHSAFKIQSGNCSVIIDPFFAPGSRFTWRDVGIVDMVLVTHDHYDHVGDAVAICQSCGAKLGAIVETAQKLASKGIPDSQILNGIGFNIGGTVSYQGISATMTQAFHSSESGAPVGYVIRMPEGPVIYHAGDTGIFGTMANLGKIYGIELALLPMGGIFTMDANQAAHACRLIGCNTVIPMHWRTFPVLAQSTDEFRKKLGQVAPTCQCITMEPGQSREF